MRAILVAALMVVGMVSTSSPAAAANDPIESVLCGQPGEVTVRLYRLFFDREPDPEGLAYWSEVYRQTRSYNIVAYYMAQGAEYRNAWGGVDNEGYVEGLLYQNLLNREPEQEGFDFWVSNLSVDQVPRHELAVYWVIQPELINNHPVVQPAECDLLGQAKNIPGGRALEFDYNDYELKASSSRCGVASINANWAYPNGANPYTEHIGFAAIDGQILPSRNGIHDDNSRGILGARRMGYGGEQAEFTHTFDTSIGELNILSNLVQKDSHMLQLHANYWDQRGGGEFYQNKFDNQYDGWDWAVGGISLVVNGQQNADMNNAYTFNTTRHTFVAFKAPSTVMIGGTTSMTAQQLINWLTAQGYTDIMKMDGGGSAEFNENLKATAAGTSRPLPVWLGVGC